MSKQRMTYAINQVAIDALREIAHRRTQASGQRVAAGTVLEDIIMKEMARLDALKVGKIDRSDHVTGNRKGRPKGSKSKEKATAQIGNIGNLDGLDKELGL